MPDLPDDPPIRHAICDDGIVDPNASLKLTNNYCIFIRINTIDNNCLLRNGVVQP
ncbi:hypothetical protein [Azospirillum argentinense]